MNRQFSSKIFSLFYFGIIFYYTLDKTMDIYYKEFLVVFVVTTIVLEAMSSYFFLHAQWHAKNNLGFIFYIIIFL